MNWASLEPLGVVKKGGLRSDMCLTGSLRLASVFRGCKGRRAEPGPGTRTVTIQATGNGHPQGLQQWSECIVRERKQLRDALTLLAWTRGNVEMLSKEQSLEEAGRAVSIGHAGFEMSVKGLRGDRCCAGYMNPKTGKDI